MFHLLPVVIIIVLLLAYFHPGKTPPLEKTLSITRAGKYQMVLAAKLNLAQPFLEEVAQRIRPLIVGVDGFAIQYFVVLDKQVNAHGNNKYLLAIGCRNQVVYFYAENPNSRSPNHYLNIIKGYSSDCSIDFPLGDANRDTLKAIIADATIKVAQETGIEVNKLA
jgi:hypothetical protein